MSFSFQILNHSKKSRARTGRINTPHGVIETPSFVTVGTKATVKSLTPEDLSLTGTQFIFVNTYHMALSPGVDIVKKVGGLHKFSGLNKPIITDSGGFQVFSLAGHKKIKVTHQEQEDMKKQDATLVKIGEEGVKFKSHIDGKVFNFTPEFSIQSQIDIGGDFAVSFDEDIYNGAGYDYTKSATDRTHRWAKRSLDYFKAHAGRNQQLYGIIHGGRYEDLRKYSSNYIASLPFWGLALGGISVNISKGEFANEVKWVSDVVYADTRARHLLGIGTLDEIIYGIKAGFDTFDCVLPPRHARIGWLYLGLNKHIDILQKKYSSDFLPINPECTCYVCVNFTRSYLHHLFKQKELLAYRLATIHNLYTVEEFFKDIREQIKSGKL